MSKDVAEMIIVGSLDNAISDMAKTPKVLRAKKVKNLNVLPENFSEVLEIVEAPKIEILDFPSRTTSIRKAIKAKPKDRVKDDSIVVVDKKQAARKHKKLKGFFAREGKRVSRETEKLDKKATKPAKFARKTKSPYWQLSGKLSNIYSQYRKSAMTGALVLMMLGFVTATTYVTYAYVTSRDADLVNSVAKHVVLSQNETPKVYIVQSEKADLFKNPLFKGIQVGDNVLTYTNQGRVIIYRASEDKIVNIVNLQN